MRLMPHVVCKGNDPRSHARDRVSDCSTPTGTTRPRGPGLWFCARRCWMESTEDTGRVRRPRGRGLLALVAVMSLSAGCAPDPAGPIPFDRSDKQTAGGGAETCEDIARIANNARQGFIAVESEAIARVTRPTLEALAVEIDRSDVDSYQLDTLFFAASTVWTRGVAGSG